MSGHMKTISIQRIEKDIEVNAPVSVVYRQWTQFEDFPKFMEGVKSVIQIDERHLAWRAEILGREVDWDAEITIQVPNQQISWHSTSGHPNKGTVFFTPTGPDKTKVTLIMEYELQGAAERIADALGILSFRIAGDLRRFRKFIEERGIPNGGWNGHISMPAGI